MKSLILRAPEIRSLLDSGECVELRPIPVSPNDDYMAGSDGMVYSRTKNAGPGRKKYVDWYPLKGAKSAKGYQIISLCHNNKKVTRSVHRLICMAFHGMPSSSSLQVRHLDGNPCNNRPDNLAWGTQYENWADRRAHGRARDRGDHQNAKFTNEEREHIRWAVLNGLCSERHAAIALGVSYVAIGAIVDKG